MENTSLAVLVWAYDIWIGRDSSIIRAGTF